MEKQKISWHSVEYMFDKCPFCGEIPNVFQIPDDRYGTKYGWIVECKNMGCIFHRTSPDQSLPHLQERWNKRI